MFKTFIFTAFITMLTFSHNNSEASLLSKIEAMTQPFDNITLAIGGEGRRLPGGSCRCPRREDGGSDENADDEA